MHTYTNKCLWYRWSLRLTDSISDNLPIVITIVMQDVTTGGSKVKGTWALYFLQHVHTQLPQNEVGTKEDIIINTTVIRVEGNRAHGSTEPCGWRRIGTWFKYTHAHAPLQWFKVKTTENVGIRFPGHNARLRNKTTPVFYMWKVLALPSTAYLFVGINHIMFKLKSFLC